MISKQFYEKQLAYDKEFKREYKEIKDKDKEKEKEKEHKEYKEHIKEKEIHKEELLEVQQTQYPGVGPGPGPEAAQASASITKLVEHKQYVEKAIFKEYKHEIKEHKYEGKEFKEKDFYEGKQLVENTGYPGQGVDPYAQRIAALEATVAQLVHFIPAELRPDLSQGALKQEPDAPKQDAPAPKETKK